MYIYICLYWACNGDDSLHTSIYIYIEHVYKQKQQMFFVFFAQLRYRHCYCIDELLISMQSVWYWLNTDTHSLQARIQFTNFLFFHWASQLIRTSKILKLTGFSIDRRFYLSCRLLVSMCFHDNKSHEWIFQTEIIGYSYRITTSQCTYCYLQFEMKTHFPRDA